MPRFEATFEIDTDRNIHANHWGADFDRPRRCEDDQVRDFAATFGADKYDQWDDDARPFVRLVQVEPWLGVSGRQGETLTQIQHVAYDGLLGEDAARLDQGRGNPVELAMYAKLARICNIAEAGTPDEDWRPLIEDEPGGDIVGGGEGPVGPCCPNCGREHVAGSGCALGVVVSVIRDRGDLDFDALRQDEIASIDVHRFWEAMETAISEVERQLREMIE